MATFGCTYGNSCRLFVALVVAVVGGCGAPEQMPADRGAPKSNVEADVVEMPSEVNPVVWSAAVVPPSATSDSEIMLEIRARMAAGWTIHPVGTAVGPGSATTLELELPPGVEAIGEWELPMTRRPAERLGSGPVYEGDVTFRRTLKVAAEQAPGSLDIGCEVGFQACDAEMCRRPELRPLEATVRIQE